MDADSTPHSVLVDRFSENTSSSEQTLNKLSSELEEARRTDPDQVPVLLVSQARQLALIGRYSEARQHARTAISLSSNSPTVAEALITLGICAAETEDLDEAERTLNAAVEECRRTNDKKNLAQALHELAVCVVATRGKYNLALSLMDEAQSLRSELGVRHWAGPWLHSYIALITGDRQRARRSLDELVTLIEPATQVAGGYYYLWAKLAIDDEEYEKAHEYLRLGLRIAAQTGVPNLSIWIRIEHSRYYRKIGKLPLAREWAEEAVSSARQFGVRHLEGQALAEAAIVAWEAGEYHTAFGDLTQARAIFTQLRTEFDLAYAAYLWALWLQQSNHPDAGPAWCEAVRLIHLGGYAFILEREQEAAFPLIAFHLRSADPQTRSASETILHQLVNVRPLPLRISTLGQFSVRKGRQLIAEKLWQRRKTGELFRFLLIQPNRTASKDSIIDALWPDALINSGEDLLHQATSTLRRILEPDLPDKFPSRYLSYEGEQITLLLPPGSVVDFEIFMQNVPAAIQSHNHETLQDVLHLYMGILFPADRYADWSEELRTRLSELHMSGLLELARQHFTQYQFADALDCTRQVLKQDPWNEDAVLLAMQVYMELGAAPHAMRIYQKLETDLKTDLDLSPRADLRSLADYIRNR